MEPMVEQSRSMALEENQKAREHKFNKTFNIGANWELNACVGNNGWNDHKTYEDGYKEAVELIIAGLNNGDATQDCSIYPLVFCARHQIELFLKRQLYRLRVLRNDTEITDIELTSTHDLGKLWDLFKIFGIRHDKRLLDFISNSEEYILDFAEIDPTGETFRYPNDKYKTKHLKDTPVINITVFYNRYLKLTELIEAFDWLMGELVDEYATKTYTPELSRNDIHEIAKRLPCRDKWGADDFKKHKEEIKKEYGLSNHKFSKVLDLIQDHQQFCAEIGLEKPFPELTPEQFKTYIDIFKPLQAFFRKRDEEKEVKKRKDYPELNSNELFIYKFDYSDFKTSEIEKKSFKKYWMNYPMKQLSF